MVKVEHHCQHSSGYVTVLETTKSIHGRAPKVTNENLCISSDHQCCSESLHTNERGTLRITKPLCFFILRLYFFLICFKDFRLLNVMNIPYFHFVLMEITASTPKKLLTI